MSDETNYLLLLAAIPGGLLIYWLATRFTTKPAVIAVIVPAVALLDFVVRSYHLPANRYAIFAIYCTAGWATIGIRHALGRPGKNEQN